MVDASAQLPKGARESGCGYPGAGYPKGFGMMNPRPFGERVAGRPVRGPFFLPANPRNTLHLPS
jgi:hypothetical protein